MKNVFFCLLFSFLFFVVFVLGVFFGAALRSPAGSGRSVRDLECTCVPCLPDKFCQKCGHKSRDCPRLAWYFKRATNIVQRLVK